MEMIREISLNDYEAKEIAIRDPYPVNIYGYRLSRQPFDLSERNKVIKYKYGAYGFKNEEEAVEDAKRRVMNWQKIDNGVNLWYIELYSCEQKEFSPDTKAYKILSIESELYQNMRNRDKLLGDIED